MHEAQDDPCVRRSDNAPRGTHGGMDATSHIGRRAVDRRSPMSVGRATLIT